MNVNFTVVTATSSTAATTTTTTTTTKTSEGGARCSNFLCKLAGERRSGQDQVHRLWKGKKAFTDEVQPVLHPALHQYLVREKQGGGACDVIVAVVTAIGDGGGDTDGSRETAEKAAPSTEEPSD